jgi:hypothetical protein
MTFNASSNSIALRLNRIRRVPRHDARRTGILCATKKVPYLQFPSDDDGIFRTAGDTVNTIAAIRSALMNYKHRILNQCKFYSQDLINNLFTHPYTKIAFIERDLKVSRLTATKYLDALAERGFLQKQKIGRANYYINVALNRILIGAEMGPGSV